MPRSARIDIAGLLQHVMVRGIEKTDIFVDDRDRSAFLDRLSKLLITTETQCLAWALMSNHFHLLLRPTKRKLSELMRRLLTGYAVVFNLRHHRSGHLFQNRYKSVACEEDRYLLELVRYIHLNPMRAHLVDSLEKLDSYRWSGHSVVMGNNALAGQNVDQVLLLFDQYRKHAMEKYRCFVADGIALGKRDELAGGGLKRHLSFSQVNVFQAYDQRILGGGEFVEQVWKEAEQIEVAPPSLPLDEVAARTSAVFGIAPDALRHRSKRREFTAARSAFCYVATKRIGYPSAELARYLGVTRSAVVLAATKGESIYHMSPALQRLFPD